MTSIFLDVVVVYPCGPLALGVEKPDKDGELEHIVEGNEVKDEAGELIDHVEQAEDHPVGEPLLVVAQAVRFERVEAHEHGVSHAQESRQDRLPDAEYHEKNQTDKTILK